MEAPQAAGETDEASGPGEKPRPSRPTVIVRYGLMGSLGEFRHSLDPTPRPRSLVVVRTERGVELGEVIATVCREPGGGLITCEQLRRFTEECGPDYPIRRDGRVLRPANPQDVIDYRHLQQSAREAAIYCRQQIRELGLNMKLVTVEHLLGGERIIFYFSAEHRVDFRELVRRLAGQFRTRIEMRQVGARDEARLVGDYERCGQRCCCQGFLKYLKPVSMRMAKTQKATLDPSKISGRCGRLMCCLRYEDDTYEELRKRLPRKNTWVRTAQVLGRVVDGQIITQLVRLQVVDGTQVTVAVEDIVERDVPAPPIQEQQAPVGPMSPAARRLRAATTKAQAAGRAAAAEEALSAETGPEAIAEPAEPADAEPEAVAGAAPEVTEEAAAEAEAGEPIPAATGEEPAEAVPLASGARKKHRRRRRSKGLRPEGGGPSGDAAGLPPSRPGLPGLPRPHSGEPGGRPQAAPTQPPAQVVPKQGPIETAAGSRQEDDAGSTEQASGHAESDQPVAPAGPAEGGGQRPAEVSASGKASPDQRHLPRRHHRSRHRRHK